MTNFEAVKCYQCVLEALLVFLKIQWKPFCLPANDRLTGITGKDC